MKYPEINEGRPALFAIAVAFWVAGAMALAVRGAGVAETNPVSENVRGHENIEWNTAYGYDMVRGGGRPRVLLVGDSIVCEYESGVRRRLSGQVNVSYWASSYCVTSPGYLKLLEHQLDEAAFDVVHFNNGLHSTGRNLPAYAASMAAAVRLIHAKQPKAKVVWATSTPLKDPAKNKTVIALNAAARPAVIAAGVATVDDLYALADPLDRAKHWSDCYHHKPALVEILAERVAETVLAQAFDETAEIQRAIDAAWRKGGGTVNVPSGRHRIGGLRLRSGVTLHLDRDCVLVGSRNPEDCYDVLRRDRVQPLSREELDTDLVTPAARQAKVGARRGHVFGSLWNNALVRIYGAHDCAIVGEAGSVIDGGNCADPHGEERYRGPMAINASLSTNLTFRGYEVRRAGNYSHQLVCCARVTVDGVKIRGGHDGVHLTDVDVARVLNCDIATGDDAVAGWANTDVVVSNCVLNSACSPVRFGGTDVLITDCRATGPCEWAHRYTIGLERQLSGGSDENGRHNIGCFLQYFTGEDIAMRRKPGNMVFRNMTIENPSRFMVMLTGLNALWQTGPAIGRIRFENVVATGIERPSAVWAPWNYPLTLEFDRCRLAFKTHQDQAFFGQNLTVTCRETTVENADRTYAPWSAEPETFVKTVVPEFPSWSFDHPEADLR